MNPFFQIHVNMIVNQVEDALWNLHQVDREARKASERVLVFQKNLEDHVLKHQQNAQGVNSNALTEMEINSKKKFNL